MRVLSLSVIAQTRNLHFRLQISDSEKTERCFRPAFDVTVIVDPMEVFRPLFRIVGERHGEVIYIPRRKIQVEQEGDCETLLRPH
jgi:hypothetical protein